MKHWGWSLGGWKIRGPLMDERELVWGQVGWAGMRGQMGPFGLELGLFRPR